MNQERDTLYMTDKNDRKCPEDAPWALEMETELASRQKDPPEHVHPPLHHSGVADVTLQHPLLLWSGSTP